MHLKSKLQIRIKEKIIEKVIGKVEEKEKYKVNEVDIEFKKKKIQEKITDYVKVKLRRK